MVAGRISLTIDDVKAMKVAVIIKHGAAPLAFEDPIGKRITFDHGQPGPPSKEIAGDAGNMVCHRLVRRGVSTPVADGFGGTLLSELPLIR